MAFFNKTGVGSALQRMALGLGLIALLSTILLLSDLGHRRMSAAAAATGVHALSAGKMYKAAIVYYARDLGTDMCVQGLLDGLKASGVEEGKNLEVHRADAQA